MPTVVHPDTVYNGCAVDIRRRGLRHYAVFREYVGACTESGNITAYYPLTDRELEYARSLIYYKDFYADYLELFVFWEALRVRRGDRQYWEMAKNAADIKAVLKVID
jgi:hypothetical protein